MIYSMYVQIQQVCDSIIQSLNVPCNYNGSQSYRFVSFLFACLIMVLMEWSEVTKITSLHSLLLTLSLVIWAIVIQTSWLR